MEAVGFFGDRAEESGGLGMAEGEPGIDAPSTFDAIGGEMKDGFRDTEYGDENDPLRPPLVRWAPFGLRGVIVNSFPSAGGAVPVAGVGRYGAGGVSPATLDREDAPDGEVVELATDSLSTEDATPLRVLAIEREPTARRDRGDTRLTRRPTLAWLWLLLLVRLLAVSALVPVGPASTTTGGDDIEGQGGRPPLAGVACGSTCPGLLSSHSPTRTSTRALAGLGDAGGSWRKSPTGGPCA